MRPAPLLPCLLLAAACADQPPANDMAANQTTTVTPGPSAELRTGSTRGSASSPPAAQPTAQATKEQTPDYTFAYAYPAAAAAIGPLDAWFRADRDRARAAVARDAAAFRREMAAGGFPFRQYESTTEWRVVTGTPRLLSLSAERYDYTGGAHGSSGFDAVVWDKATGRRRAPIDLFVSQGALQEAVGARFCDRLDAERGKRRGTPVIRSNDGFDACIPISDATLILGSTDRRHIDRLGFLVGPYAAGPFAEGSYDLTLPVTSAVIAAARPEWRDAFRAR